MGYIHYGSHTVYDIQYHIVWTTKYRYKILQGKIAIRLRDLIRQGCEARNIQIIRGSIGKEHVHLLVSCPPNLAPSKLLQYLKGRSSKILQEEFKELRQRYWGQHLWGKRQIAHTFLVDVGLQYYLDNLLKAMQETGIVVDQGSN